MGGTGEEDTGGWTRGEGRKGKADTGGWVEKKTQIQRLDGKGGEGLEVYLIKVRKFSLGSWGKREER